MTVDEFRNHLKKASIWRAFIHCYLGHVEVWVPKKRMIIVRDLLEQRLDAGATYEVLELRSPLRFKKYTYEYLECYN